LGQGREVVPMNQENVKTFTVRQLHWWRCAMHDPPVLPPAFDLACCAISPLKTKKGAPVRDPEKGPSEGTVGSRSLTGRNWGGR
jgi:hypothetical protein